MVNIKKLVAAVLLFSSIQIHSQSRATLEDQGYDHLNAHDYVSAYDVFDKLHTRYPAEMDYQFKLGICAISYPEKKARGIEIFKEMKEKYKTVEFDVWLAKAYHRNYKFDEALALLNPLVTPLTVSKKKEDKILLEEAELTIMNCENGKTLIKNKVIADIENIGSPVNTSEIEGVPILTADESLMMFTYVGKKSLGGRMNAQMQKDPAGIYTSDIYMSKKDSAGINWLPPQPVIALNTKGNDAALALSPDGLTLFTFLSNNENEGDIQVSNLSGQEFSKPVSLNKNINTPEYWEGSCAISADGKYLYFASERPEGLGGRDLYVSEMINGDWGPAVNLGPKINTIYDEDAPFIHPDGITLFFSSKGHVSIGGYDIMFSIKQGNEWLAPKSMGIPLNTVEDDSYYVINPKGDKGYFSSTRDFKHSKGEQDIYMVTPGILGERPVVAMLKGTVYGNGKPIEAKLDVVKISTQEHIGPYSTNEVTGKYLTALSPGHQYRIGITANGYTTLEEEFNIENLSAFVEITKDFSLTAGPAEPAQKGVIAVATLVAATTPQATTPVPTEPVAAKETDAVVVKNDVKETVVEETSPELIQSAKKTEAAELEKTEKVAAAKQKEADKNAALEAQKAVAKEKEEAKKVAAEQAKKEKVELALAKKAEAEEKKEQARLDKLAKQIAAKEPAVEKPEGIEVVTPCEETLPNLDELKGKSLNERVKYERMLAILGEFCADGLIYTVQIGAYKKPDNYKYKNLQELGQVSSATYPDGITRFTQKQFNTMKEAEVQRQRAISKGQKDAWIVAFVKGKRYTLEDLIMLDFLAKPIN